VEVVRQEPSRRLFQIGFTLALALKHRADRLARRPLGRVDGEYLLWPDIAAAVRELRRPRPLRALRVEGAEPVPFRSLREIQETESLLGRAEHQQTLFAALLGGSEPAARAALSRLAPDWPVGGTPAVLLAALAHAAVDGTLLVAPFPQAQIAALASALLEGAADAPRLRRETRDRLAAQLAALAPASSQEAARLVDAALEKLLSEVGPALARGELPLEVSTLLPMR
jgi:soluble lytic murein transglycosylase-like protein